MNQNIFSKPFSILKKYPKLFIPKIILAFLYGVLMLRMAELLKTIFIPLQLIQEISGKSFSKLTLEEIEAINLIQNFSGEILFLFIFSLFLFFLDPLVNAMYPKILSDVKKGNNISLLNSFIFSIRRFFKGTLLILLVQTLMFIPLFFLPNPLTQGFSLFSIGLALVISLALLIPLYLIYPVAMLEDKSWAEKLKKTVFLSKKNFSLMTKASILMLIFGAFNIAVSFFVVDIYGLVLFFSLRLISALFYTYNMVLNPEIYFEVNSND